ncbi:MAG TPA: protease, partial [Armatimonadota bacterium]|nr:protease [Armatimonadota bacterium]
MPRPLLLLFALLLVTLPAAVRGGVPTSSFLRRPDIHGDRVVFTSEGDLWLGSVKGGTARRLTTHEGLEGAARFSPDGALLAFTGQYDGGTDIYVMPAEGGSPRRLTYGAGGVTVGWTPEGKQVLYRSRRASPEGNNRLWSVPVEGGMPRLLPIPRAELASMHRDGRRVAYVPVSGEWQHWKRYQGGQADDIWLADLEAKTFKKLTDYAGVDTAPVWAGDRIYFVSERNDVANLFRMDASGGKVTPVTRYTDFDVRYPASDGERVVFEYGNGIALLDPKGDEVRPLAFTLGSERVHARPRRIPVQQSVNWSNIGPSGKRLLFEARGQILTVPVESGDFRMIAPRPGSRSQYPAWSPDGKWIAFVSDRSGEEQVWVAPAAGAGAPRQLTTDHRGPLGALIWSPDSKRIAVGDREMRIMVVDVETGALTQVDQSDRGGSYDATNYSYRFSPDSRWLAYHKTEPNDNNVVYLYELATAKKVPVSSPEMNSYGPSFDPTGKYLAFLSDRSFNPQGTGPTRFFAVQKTTKVSLLTLAAETPSPFLLTNDEEAMPDATPAPPAAADPTAKTEPAAPGGERPAAVEAKPVKVDLEGIAQRIIDVP